MSVAPPERTARGPRAKRRRWWLAGLCLALILAFDWTRPPARQVSAGLELAAIRRYQSWISPWLQKGGVRCRFTPSCSHYAAAVVARDGFVAGNFRALGRLARCGPWTRAGTVDPP
jgi:putative component of membrane protein insertase Oxa1/YidC/SpoIIIJ protein YidD